MKKIVTVCGMGIGTSVLLKMNLEKVVKQRGLEATVIASDIDSVPHKSEDADVILTSAEFEPRLTGLPAQVIVISNFFDLDEIDDKLADLLGEE